MNPTHIVIHNSATKDSGTVSWGAIRRYHTDVKGWTDIGYHFGIEQVGFEFEALVGRMPDKQGAHCLARGMNSHAIGVCCVGDFDRYPVPNEQFALCLEITRYLMRTYNIPAGNVIGHREVEPKKNCPGLLFDMDLFRSSL
jgi:hypothetical protein